MSWSVEYTTFNEAEIRFIGEDTPENNKAQKAAVDAAGKIIASGVLGDPKKNRFSVRVSGHNNPNNEPVAGYSNETLSINIYQMNVDDDA